MLFVFWLRNRLSVMCACGNEGMDEGHPKCVQVHTGGEGYHASCVPTLLQTITLFMFLS